jgi:hypothetical protein
MSFPLGGALLYLRIKMSYFRIDGSLRGDSSSFSGSHTLAPFDLHHTCIFSHHFAKFSWREALYVPNYEQARPNLGRATPNLADSAKTAVNSCLGS